MVFPGGWTELEQAQPRSIKQIISYASMYDGATTHEGTVVNSAIYHVPTGGSWVTTPITINAEPTVVAVNENYLVDEKMKAMAMNMQTKMAKLTGAPIPLSNLVYLYGNPAFKSLYKMEIPLSFGPNNYDTVQISVMENAATSGNEHDTIEAIDFGSGGPFTNVNTFTLIFNGFFGQLNLGFRLESSANQSSIFELRSIIMPVNM